MDKGFMLHVLGRAEAAVPALLEADADSWHTLDVDYEPPRVERLWRDFEKDYRIYLHRIHPCDKALFHPHPWASAIKVLSGKYVMGVGYTLDNVPPTEAATIVLAAGSYYEMIDPDGWHYVRPIGGPSLSIMVTGPKWDRWSPKADHKLGPLTDIAKRVLLDDFSRIYRK